MARRTNKLLSSWEHEISAGTSSAAATYQKYISVWTKLECRTNIYARKLATSVHATIFLETYPFHGVSSRILDTIQFVFHIQYALRSLLLTRLLQLSFSWKIVFIWGCKAIYVVWKNNWTIIHDMKWELNFLL